MYLGNGDVGGIVKPHSFRSRCTRT
jgi:hypothetical protein